MEQRLDLAKGDTDADADEASGDDASSPSCRCSVCKVGRMVRIRSVGPHDEPRWLELGAIREDSS